MSEADDRSKLFAELEEIDKRIAEAVNQRVAWHKKFALVRAQDSSALLPLSISLRETQKRISHGVVEVEGEAALPLARELWSLSQRVLNGGRVLLLHDLGSISHLAAREYFGGSIRIEKQSALSQLLRTVEHEPSSYAVIPIETTRDGLIAHNLVSLALSKLEIVRELSGTSQMSMFSVTGNPRDVEKIYVSAEDHPCVLRTLRVRYPKAMVLEVPNAISALPFVRDDHGSAVVGSVVLSMIDATIRVADESVEDDSYQIRYAVVGREVVKRTGQDRTRIALALREEPGALHDALSPFASFGVNVVQLESRPARGTIFRDLFFLEIEGHISERSTISAIEEVRSRSRFLRVLGSYPAADALR